MIQMFFKYGKMSTCDNLNSNYLKVKKSINTSLALSNFKKSTIETEEGIKSLQVLLNKLGFYQKAERALRNKTAFFRIILKNRKLKESLMRLRRGGYRLNKGIDGDYGDSTKMAVSYFQFQELGKVDGAFGVNTLRLLEISTVFNECKKSKKRLKLLLQRKAVLKRLAKRRMFNDVKRRLSTLKQDFSPTHTVKLIGRTPLNFRNRMHISKNTLITTLGEGTLVQVLSTKTKGGRRWSKIRVKINGRMRIGYVASMYLRKKRRRFMSEYTGPRRPYRKRNRVKNRRVVNNRRLQRRETSRRSKRKRFYIPTYQRASILENRERSVLIRRLTVSRVKSLLNSPKGRRSIRKLFINKHHQFSVPKKFRALNSLVEAKYTLMDLIGGKRKKQIWIMRTNGRLTIATLGINQNRQEDYVWSQKKVTENQSYSDKRRKHFSVGLGERIFFDEPSAKESAYRIEWGRPEELIDKNSAVWRHPGLHPSLKRKKNRILGYRGDKHESKRHDIYTGTLKAVNAAAWQAEAEGYTLYVTSGNRWGISKSKRHAQDGGPGGDIDFVVKGQRRGERAPAKINARIMLAGFKSGATNFGHGVGNNSGNHMGWKSSEIARRTSKRGPKSWNYGGNGVDAEKEFKKLLEIIK